jgi:hypothetical protein
MASSAGVIAIIRRGHADSFLASFSEEITWRLDEADPGWGRAFARDKLVVEDMAFSPCGTAPVG